MKLDQETSYSKRSPTTKGVSTFAGGWPVDLTVLICEKVEDQTSDTTAKAHKNLFHIKAIYSRFDCFLKGLMRLVNLVMPDLHGIKNAEPNSDSA